MKKIKLLLMCFVLLSSLGLYAASPVTQVITDNLTWTWNAFVHPANIPFVYEYSINGGAWTETTETSFTAAGLAERGNQSFRVRVKLLTTPTQVTSPDDENVDSFGIDNTPPTLLTLDINQGSLGTASTLVDVSVNSHDSYGNGSGIIYCEASIDEMEYYGFSGTGLVLTSYYGQHTISIRAYDLAGHVSNVVSDDIFLARNVSTISGTSADALEATLKDLRSNLTQTVNVDSGAFQFAGIPDGVYGLVLTNNDVMKAYEKRISVHDGIAVEIDEITLGTETGSISGELSTDNVAVAAGIDLGQGLFLKVNETVTGSGSYAIDALAPGNYTLKAFPEASAGMLPAVADVSVVASETTTQNLNLNAGYRVTGFSKVRNVLVQAVSSNGRFESALIDENGNCNMVLPSGDYYFIVRSEYCSMEPQFYTINSDMTLSGFVCDQSNTLLSGTLNNTGLVLSAEAGINKTLQVCSGEKMSGYLTSFSGEYNEAQTTWYSVVSESMTAINALYLLADDMARGIHSFNQVDAGSDEGSNITVNSAGGSISGVVTLNGAPVVKPRVVLLDSASAVVGTCQGSSAGEYFFKNLPVAAYTMWVIDTENDVSKDLTPAIALNQNTVLNVELAETTLSITDYETEVTDGLFNATLELANLEAGSSYKINAALFNSDWSRVMGSKTMAVTNGTVNLEMSLAGASGTNCHFKVALYKGSNTRPEASEIKNGINVVYIAKPLTITAYETEVTDGLFNATVELANLDAGSSYKMNAAVFNSDWTRIMGSKTMTVTNGTVNLEMSLGKLSGANCHFKVALYKGSNTVAEASEIKNGINVVYTPKTLRITAYETTVTDGLFNATVELDNLDASSSYKMNVALFNSDWTRIMGSKTMTVANGTVNLEINLAGLSGTNCHLKVALYKGSNTVAEASEIKNGITVVHTVKTLSVTAYETTVIDGLFNATVELANLDAGSSYKMNAALFNSDWTRIIGSKSMSVINGTVNLEISVAGLSGANCHLKVALYKGSNTVAEASEIKNGINIS